MSSQLTTPRLRELDEYAALVLHRSECEVVFHRKPWHSEQQSASDKLWRLWNSVIVGLVFF
eukprot:4155323-Amphidinium_carterae.1